MSESSDIVVNVIKNPVIDIVLFKIEQWISTNMKKKQKNKKKSTITTKNEKDNSNEFIKLAPVAKGEIFRLGELPSSSSLAAAAAMSGEIASDIETRRKRLIFGINAILKVVNRYDNGATKLDAVLMARKGINPWLCGYVAQACGTKCDFYLLDITPRELATKIFKDGSVKTCMIIGIPDVSDYTDSRYNPFEQIMKSLTKPFE